MKLLNNIKIYYENLSLVKKIFVIPFLSIFFGLILLYTSHHHANTLAQNTNILHTKYIPLLEKSNQNIALLNQLVETYSFIVNTDEEELYLQTKENTKKINDNLNYIENSNVFEKDYIKSVKYNYAQYNKVVEQSIYNILEANQLQLSNKLYLDQMFQLLQQVQKDFQFLNSDIKKILVENKNNVQNTLEYITFSEIQNIIVTYLLLLLFSWFVYLSVNKKFKNLISTISTLGENSLSFKARLNESKSDEISFLSNQINEIFQSFEEKYQKLDIEKEKYTKIATIDQLTQIPNRYYLTEMLEKFQSDKRTYGLAILDIDKFKSVNDTYGHDVGDIVLQKVAKILEENTRKSDIVGRWGGEEFLILLNLDDEKTLANSLNKVREAIEQTSIETVGGVTASFGARLNTTQEEYSILLKEADLALYEAKHGGRNQVKIFTVK